MTPYAGAVLNWLRVHGPQTYRQLAWALDLDMDVIVDAIQAHSKNTATSRRRRMEDTNTRHHMTTDWFTAAECRGLDPEMFHPGRGDHTTIDAARTVCADCPVARHCLHWALTWPEHHGIWGGHTERERRVLRKQLHRHGVLIHQRCHTCRATFAPSGIGPGRYTSHQCPQCRYQAAHAAGWGHRLERPA